MLFLLVALSVVMLFKYRYFSLNGTNIAFHEDLNPQISHILKLLIYDLFEDLNLREIG